MKRIHVTMTDGSVWSVPAETVAVNRAKFWAEGELDYEKVFDEEYTYTLDHDYELKDWARNNMNWSDVVDRARKESDPPKQAVNFQEGWVHGPMAIVESEH